MAMLLQTSIDSQLQNLITVAATASSNYRAMGGTRDIIAGYKAFIATNYKRHIVERHVDVPLAERFVTELEECSKLSTIFFDGAASKLDDLEQCSAIELNVIEDEQAKKKEIMQSGLAALKIISPEHHALAELLVTDIVVLPSRLAFGGSTSDGLGIVWANPNLNWRALDASEFLVHELTHQCMFLDEICNNHYHYDAILKEENWAQSAILNKLRPVDKVLHSVAVAIELLLFRERAGHPASSKAHPPTTKLIQQTNNSIASLKELNNRNHHLLTDRAKEILENCSAHLATLKTICELET